MNQLTNGNILIFIDTETNDVKNPMLIQLGYMLIEVDSTTDRGYRVIREVGTLVNQGADLIMNKYAFAVHGISVEQCVKYGIDPYGAAGTLAHDIQLADVMVFHNASFDLRVLTLLGQTCWPGLATLLKLTPSHCTMKTTKGFCGLLDKRDNPKNPKLVELYDELFNAPYKNQHDALGDVRATLRCYFALPEELQWQG